MPDIDNEFWHLPAVQILGGVGIAISAIVAAVMGNRSRKNSAKEENGEGMPREAVNILFTIEKFMRQNLEILHEINQQFSNAIDDQKRQSSAYDRQETAARELYERQARSLDGMLEKAREMSDILRDLQARQNANFRDISAYVNLQTDAVVKLCAIIKQYIEINSK